MTVRDGFAITVYRKRTVMAKFIIQIKQKTYKEKSK